MRKNIAFFFALLLGTMPLLSAPAPFDNPKSPLYSSPLSSHYGSIKASYKYTTLGINTIFRLPILGFGKRIRYERTAIDISTQVATTLVASLVYVDASYLGYLFRDSVYVGAGGGLSVGFAGYKPNFLTINPILKCGVELSKSFHQINFTPLTYYTALFYSKIDSTRLISYQLGYKF